MKKLLLAAMVAGSMFAMADEAKPSAEGAAPAVAAAKPSAEKIAEMKARRAKMMEARFAAMAPALTEAIKKYGLDDEQAKSLLNDIKDIVNNPAKGKAKKTKAKKSKKAKKAE